MGLVLPAAALGVHPALALREVAVAVALELGPALLAQRLVCNTGGGGGLTGGAEATSLVARTPVFALPSTSPRPRRGRPTGWGSGWKSGRPGPGPRALRAGSHPPRKARDPSLFRPPSASPASLLSLPALGEVGGGKL